MRPVKRDRSTSLVVFAADAKQLSELDVALGPCVAAAGQRRPLKSPLMQDNGETPEQASALFTVLTGRPPGEALRLVSEEGGARLFVCTDDFVSAMADASRAMLAGGGVDHFAEEQERLSAAWMSATKWSDQYVSLKNRLQRLADARVASEKSIPLYFWFGPPVPMRSVVAGAGPYRGSR